MGQPLIVEPEVWTPLPGAPGWEVWHRRKQPVVVTDHPSGIHGLALRQTPEEDR